MGESGRQHSKHGKVVRKLNLAGQRPRGKVAKRYYEVPGNKPKKKSK